MLNLQTSGIYHTDFPQYIRILTEDRFLESLAWSYMHWFYGQLDTVFVNSEQYRQSWIDRGFEPDKLKILPRGLDTELVQSARRDRAVLEALRRRTATKFGCFTSAASPRKKISMCSRLPIANCASADLPVQLFLVGDGPYCRNAGRDACPTPSSPVISPARNSPTAYASADIFVFPSTTDTFGNVIIEAQASGLPVIVSDVGGPKELVEDGVNGLVTKAHDVG